MANRNFQRLQALSSEVKVIFPNLMVTSSNAQVTAYSGEGVASGSTVQTGIFRIHLGFSGSNGQGIQVDRYTKLINYNFNVVPVSGSGNQGSQTYTATGSFAATYGTLVVNDLVQQSGTLDLCVYRLRPNSGPATTAISGSLITATDMGSDLAISGTLWLKNSSAR